MDDRGEAGGVFTVAEINNALAGPPSDNVCADCLAHPPARPARPFPRRLPAPLLRLDIYHPP